MSRDALEKKLDNLFSIWTRRKRCNENGVANCFTCNEPYHWRYLQCGHFRKRRHLSTRWEEINGEPQCPDCNGPGQGQEDTFAFRLDELHGPGTAERLTQLSHKQWNPSIDELKEKIKYYEDKIASLQ